MSSNDPQSVEEAPYKSKYPNYTRLSEAIAEQYPHATLDATVRTNKVTVSVPPGSYTKAALGDIQEMAKVHGLELECFSQTGQACTLHFRPLTPAVTVAAAFQYSRLHWCRDLSIILTTCSLMVVMVAATLAQVAPELAHDVGVWLWGRDGDSG